MYQEFTITDGETEVMAHKDMETGEWIRFYVYTEDVKAGCFPEKWKFKQSINPLFTDVIHPSPKGCVSYYRMAHAPTAIS